MKTKATRRPRSPAGESSQTIDAPTRLELAGAGVVTLASIAMHGIFIAHAGALWRDEVNSLGTASAAWSDLWRFFEFESFPPLWILLLRGWSAVGGGASDMALRVFGVAGGIAMIAAVWFVLWRFSRSLPLVSVALLAVNPEVVRWGGSVRAWSLGAALALVAIVLVREATERGSRRAIAWATIASILAVQTVYQNTVLLAVAVLCAAAPWLWRREWRRAAVPIGIGCVSAISLLPYAGLIGRRADWTGLSEAPVTLTDLLSKLWGLISASGPVVSAAWVGVVLLGLVSVVRPGMKRANRAYALSVGGLGVVGLIAFYLLFHYPTQHWYYLGLAALVAVAGESAMAIPRGGVISPKARAVLAMAVLAAGAAPALAALRVPQTNMHLIAARVTADAQPGDLIVVTPWYHGVAFAHYYRGSVTVMTLPPIADLRVHRYDLLKRAMLESDATRSLREQIEKTLSSGHRLWLVGAIAAPAPGSTPPRLGPPPLPTTRWNAGPYEQMWILDIGDLVAKHGRSGEFLPTDVAIPFESPRLAVVQGWR